MILQEISDSFSELGVHLNSDWLAVLEIVQDELLSVDSVYTALMLSDLRESCDLPTTHKLSLAKLANSTSQFPEGSFLFQITKAIDISIDDAQRPRSTNSSRRVLKLILQYGSLSIDAVEVEPITQLRDVPDAGMKIIVSGSPTYCNKFLLLKSHNVQVAGGEIPTLSAAQKEEHLGRQKMRDPLVYRPPLGGISNR